MDKNTLTQNIIKIFKMNNRELIDYARRVSMSNVDDMAKYFLNRAIDLRREELAHWDTDSALAVSSEIDSEGF